MIRCICGLLCLLLLTLCNCRDKSCLEYPRFSQSQAPFIYITGQTEDCTHLFLGTFWIEGRAIETQGELVASEKGIYLKCSLFKNETCYFDFSKKVDEEYQVEFISMDSTDNKAIHKIKLDTTVVAQGKKVFVFRILNGFTHREITGDLVFFVSRENGILGSYISDREGTRDWVVEPSGDILKGSIDYSKKDFGIIE